MAQTRTQARTVGELGEFALIDRIVRLLPKPGAEVVIGIGDDCAAIRPTPGALTLVTCDVQIEGRHFLRDRITAYQLGRRSAAINLSDIAAMGGRPCHATISLGLPPDTELTWVDNLYRGLAEEFTRYETSVIGGNISGSRDLLIDITLLGEVAEGRAVTRCGAHRGDAVLVTGTLGDSALGRAVLLSKAKDLSAPLLARHLTPTPRVREGLAIGATGHASAMIDISDGLAGDLGHICEMSHVGMRLFADRIPLSQDARTVASRLRVDALQAALHGGEDYELAFTCAPQHVDAITQAVRSATGTPVTRIGEVVSGHGFRLVLPDGSERDEPARGWDHYKAGDRE
ncbi:MAG: thiamine-phosphate kinase [Chloroflexi bacterium]|nr:thiamine-phosphate kinase [Chloroflexota bacterium]